MTIPKDLSVLFVQGAIAGGIAEVYYGILDEVAQRVYGYLPDEFIEILKRFNKVT